MNKLEDFRDQINQIDDKILDLLSQRVKVVKKVGKYKQQRSLIIRIPQREAEILTKKAVQAEKLGLSPEFVKKIWKLFFKESYKIEE